MKMKQAIVQVECCRECPFSDFDNQEEPMKWGKTWCCTLDKEVESADDFPEDCPLEDI